MSTDIETTTKSENRTAPPDTQERVLQAIATQAARLSLPQLQYNADYLNAVQGLPFDPNPYRVMSREELGLGPSYFYDQFDTNRREKILADMRRRGVDPLTGTPGPGGVTPTGGGSTWGEAEPIRQPRQGEPAYVGGGGAWGNGDYSADELMAMRELREEEEAKRKYLEDARIRYEQVSKTPLAQLTQSAIRQEQEMQGKRQAAESEQLEQNRLQSILGAQYQRDVAPLQLRLAGQEAQLGLDRFHLLSGPETAGAEQNLAAAQASQAGAYGSENALRSDLTDLAISGRAASPAQQAIIDKRYRDQLATVEADLARQYEDSTRLLPEVATARGLRVNSADLPDRYALARREFLRQGGQAASALGAEAASASLNYPLQLGNLNVQQQYLTGQQQGRLPGAIQTSMALRQGQPQYFPGYQSEGAAFGGSSGSNAYGPFSVPLGLQGSVIGGSPFSVQAQQPLLQSRLANTQSSGQSSQSTSGGIPGMGAGGAALGGGGLALLGFKALSCWVAMELYGATSWKVPILRWYIWGPFSETRRGRLFADAYLEYGERVAAWLKKHVWAKRFVRPFFDRLLHSAQREYMRRSHG